MTLYQRFSPLCTRLLFVVNTLTVFLSFWYIECELFAVFMKILFDIWRRLAFLPSFCHLCACEMSSGWGHLNGILARVAGNLNNNFQKSEMPGGLPGGACWSFMSWCQLNFSSHQNWEAQIKSNFLFKNKHDNIFPKSAFHSATGFTSLKSSNRDKALR